MLPGWRIMSYGKGHPNQYHVYARGENTRLGSVRKNPDTIHPGTLWIAYNHRGDVIDARCTRRDACQLVFDTEAPAVGR